MTPAPRPDGAALRNLVASVAAEAELREVPMNRRPWTATGLRVGAGDQLTWLSWGRAHLVKPLAVGVDAGYALLGRIGDGPPLASGRPTTTVTADRAGVVQFGGRFPAWQQEDGSLATDRVPYRMISGRVGAVVARWGPGTDPRAALESIADRDGSGLCAAEVARLTSQPEAPPGWHHHPWTPPSDVYAPGEGGGVAIHTADSGGIVRHPAPEPLTPGLKLRWSWRVDELPSRLPEDTMLSHDYLSVAVEFDNGLDLSWQWSHSLPLGLAYPCPLDYWRKYETHVVVRSGTDGLGTWLTEERPILADYRAAIGGPVPAAVVRVWLIAVSFIQGRVGRAVVRDIELVDGGRVVRVA